MVGLHGDVNDLYIEVLSWPIMDILNQDNPVKVMSLSQPATFLILNLKKHLHFKVAMLLQLPKMIPNEFKAWDDYKEAFHIPMLQEIWDEINSGMDTISRCQCVPCPEKHSESPNVYRIKGNTEEGNVPKMGDVMLLSAEGLGSRDQIIHSRSFCTILVVLQVSTTDMIVRLSHWKFGKMKKKSYYQIMHLANLNTYLSSWEVMKCPRKSSELCNLRWTKNMNGVCPDISLLI
jgi:hypothetical protein